MSRTKIRLIIILTLIFLCLTPAAISQDDTDTPFPVARLGRGTVQYIEWHPDGEFFAVQSGTGIWLYDIDFNTLAHYPELRSITWNADGSLAFSLTDTDSQQIWHLNADFTRDIRLERPDMPYPAVWSPVANILASIIDETIHIWDATTGDDLLSIAVTINTNQLSWSPDGRYIAGWQRALGQTIWIWDTVTGEEIQELSSADIVFGEGHDVTFTMRMRDVLWMSNAHISAHGYDGDQLIWDSQTGELEFQSEACVGEWCIHYSTQQVTYSPDKTLLAQVTQSTDMAYLQYIEVIDTETSQMVRYDQFHSVSRVYWHPHERLLTVLSAGGALRHWNLNTDEFSDVFTGHVPLMETIEWSPDGTRLVAGTGTHFDVAYVQLWSSSDATSMDFENTATMELRGNTLEFHWSDDSAELITIGDYMTRRVHRQSVERWNGETGEHIETIWVRPFDNVGSDVAWNNDSTLVATVDGWDDNLQVEDVISGQLLWEIPADSNQILHIRGWNPLNDELIVCQQPYDSDEGHLEVYDGRTGQLLYEFPLESDCYRQIYWYYDGETMIIRFRDAECECSVDRIVDFESNTLLPVPETWFGYDHPEGFSSTGLYAEIESSRVTLYDGTTREFIIEIDEPVGVFSLAWHPNGQYLALGLSDGTIRIWDVSPVLEND